MLVLNVEYQDVWLSDFSTDTTLGRDLREYAKKYSQKVQRNCLFLNYCCFS